MISFAPIALFCYKRLDTLKLCIDSLKNCDESKYSDLIIFSDAPSDINSSYKVNDVRSFLPTINGFKSVDIKLRDINLGVDNNIIQGLIEMYLNYDKFIIVEDDLIVSNQFLGFLNQALEFYKNSNNIISISSFNYVRIPPNYKWDCYFAGRSNPWGWATWSNKLKNIDWDIQDKELFLSNPKIQNDFNFWGSDRSRMLKRTLNGVIKAWDIRFEYHAFKYNYYTVYPTNNLVLNNGFNSPDASNTTGYNRFKNTLKDIDILSFRLPLFVTNNKFITRRFISKNSFLNRFITSVFKLLKIYN